MARATGLVVLLAALGGCVPRHAPPPVEFAGTPSDTGCDAWLGIGGRFSQISDVRFVLENRSNNSSCQATTATVLFTGPLPADVLRVTTPSGWIAADAPCRSGTGTCGVVWRSTPGVPSGERLEGFGLEFDPAKTPRLQEWIVEVGSRGVRMPIGTVGSRLSTAPEAPSPGRRQESADVAAPSGTVIARAVDLSGQSLPGVSVTVMPEAGGAAHRATTGEDGTCRLELAQGTYRIDFEVSGFDIARRNHVRVRQGKPAAVEARLSVSAICECVYHLEAEGRRTALIALAEAEQEKLRQEGMGRAAAVEAEGRAEAAKIEAVGLAQAKAIEAQGVAEAAAILRKAEAWKEFNDAARLQTILEKLPAIIEASSGVFGAVAAPLGNIDKVVVIDQGGANGESGGGLGRFAKTSPAVVFNVLQQLEALGLNVPSVLQQLGVNASAAAPDKPAVVAAVVPAGES